MMIMSMISRIHVINGLILIKFWNWFGYLPSGLHESALICSSLGFRRKSTRIYCPPEPLEMVPKKEAAPDLTNAALPG